ncbi:hypothetical protein CP500_022910 [Tychonema bourrellyi FEM_GT703]|uniref:Uncharacterized protein n=1 Tax=Tychonema bourrellyi FEM_GT703 TaxID=2040638 RepID=A0A2G4EUF4_9CYAN|nr:hypothetical protein CP500_022910 [Tychonema bourrellyi FEM_GT703]
MNSLSNSESPLKRTNEFFSPLKRTFALRQGFQPLSDYRFYLKLTLLGHCRVLISATLETSYSD